MRKNRDTDPQPLPGVKLVEIEIDRVNVQFELVNLIPVPRGTPEPQEFTGKESEFEAFLESNFPRKTYPELWRELDEGDYAEIERVYRELGLPRGRVTPIGFYNYIVRLGELLRTVITINDHLARLMNKRPLLRLCQCGKIFEPTRKDRKTCSLTCGDRYRQAKWREDNPRYKANRIRKQDERERQQKARNKK